MKENEEIKKILEAEEPDFIRNKDNEYTEIEMLLKKEGEQIVPSNFDNVSDLCKNKVQEDAIPLAPAKKNHKKTIIYASSIAGAIILLGAVVIPLSLNAINSSVSPSEATVHLTIQTRNVLMSKIDLNNEHNFTNTNNLEFDYQINSNGYTIPSSYAGYTDNSNMVLSALKHYDQMNEAKPVDFTKQLLNYSMDCFLEKNNQYNFIIDITSKNTKYVNYLTSRMQNAIVSYGRTNNMTFSIDVEKRGPDDKSSLKERILMNIHHLFYTPMEGGIEGFVPKKLVNKSFSEKKWEEYLPTEEEELKSILDKLSIFPRVPREEDYRMLHNTLTNINFLYEERKESLTNEIDTLDALVSVSYNEKIESGNYKTGYGNLLSPYWWLNDYIDEDYDKDWAANFYSDYQTATINTYEEAKARKTTLVNYLKDNQKWFSFAFNIAMEKNRPYNADHPMDDQPWFGDKGHDEKPPEGDNWDDYWFDQYQNHGGKGPRH